MISQNRTILYVEQPWESAVPLFVNRLQQSGLQVLRTFDLHQTRMSETTCTCPNHGMEECDCQMIVLLVYGKENLPVNLIAHGHNGQTWFSLVEFLNGTNTHLEAQIRGVIESTLKDPEASEFCRRNTKEGSE